MFRNMISTKCLLKVIIYMYLYVGRERLVVEYQNTGDLLVELGSDQTSCHNPYLGGYYPVQVWTAFILFANVTVKQ